MPVGGETSKPSTVLAVGMASRVVGMELGDLFFFFFTIHSIFGFMIIGASIYDLQEVTKNAKDYVVKIVVIDDDDDDGNHVGNL